MLVVSGEIRVQTFFFLFFSSPLNQPYISIYQFYLTNNIIGSAKPSMVQDSLNLLLVGDDEDEAGSR